MVFFYENYLNIFMEQGIGGFFESLVCPATIGRNEKSFPADSQSEMILHPDYRLKFTGCAVMP
jgi:hypothetical protein